MYYFLCQDVFAPVAYGSIYKLSIDNKQGRTL